MIYVTTRRGVAAGASFETEIWDPIDCDHVSREVTADPDDLTERLRRFGFSETESEVYLAVVEAGEARPAEAASAADASKRYVYQVCERLEKRGFVVVRDHRTPTTVRAVPPDEAFDRVADELDSVSTAVETIYERPDAESEQFEVIKARETAVKRMRTMIEGADEELALSLSAEILPDVADALRDAVARDVLALLLLHGTERADPDLAGVANVVRRVEWAPTFLAVDRNTSLVVPPNLLSWDRSEGRAIAFTQNEVAPIVVGSFLGNYWSMGTELLVRRPLRPPETYGSFRRGVLDATLHLHRGRTVEATFDAAPVDEVEGDAVGTADLRRVTGRVVAVRQGLVAPTNNAFGVENALVIDDGDGRVSVGGEGALLEQYMAEAVTLRPV